MARVFVIQRRISRDQKTGEIIPHDYSSASVFGSIEVLIPTQREVDNEWNGDTQRLLETKLKDFTEKDYILPNGDPTLCVQVALVAASVLPENGKLRCLKWERQSETYKEVIFDLPF